LDPLLLIKLFV
jgi:hypothetical protein